MHRKIFSVGIILLIIGIGFTLLPFIIGRTIVVTRTFTDPPRAMRASPLRLKAGDVVEGYLIVRGGENDDIIFWIENPKGDIIYKPADKVYRFAKFDFTATIDGEYLLYFDNRFSLSYKTIYLIVKIDPFERLVWAMYLGGYLTILGAIVAIIGAVIEPKAPSKPLPPTSILLERVYCVYCGVENPGDAIFCRKCGKNIVKPA